MDGKLFEPLKYTNLCLYLSIVNLDKWTPDQEKRLHLFTAVFVNDKKLPFNPSSHNQNSEGRIIVCINKEYGVRVIEKNINGTNILFIHPLIFFNPLNNCIQKIVRGSPVIFKMERG